MLTFEAWPGTLGPLTGTPDRRPGSVRRTTSVHINWPREMDPDSDIELFAYGRDVRTGLDGMGSVPDTGEISMCARGFTREVDGLRARPRLSGMDALTGVRLTGGFRKAVADALPQIEGTVAGLLLDDIPAAVVVAGSVPIRVGIERTGSVPAWLTGPSMEGAVATPFNCRGHRRGGAMEERRMAGAPLLGQGPPAGDLGRPDDPLAWHEMPSLSPVSIRRMRRIDVTPVGDELVIDTYFRDSVLEDSAVETSVHEYEVSATAGAGDHAVRSVAVRPRVLPGPECAQTAGSAQHVVGRPLGELRGFVRKQMRGESICAHLNDQLRALADVPALVALLD